ncbi:conserved hypothetical protein [Stigmatella aurantiaca DW4/3-1]|uniref:Uncharacterized protein n=1 Tax=Stigmatella aurantiaca (strain DW4/3-1) TaxID=378806 RepID=Q09A16_STIAD|nr:conserved hypothetical protein [Stigmatella aurantiaca DW4/3-1]
MSPGRVVRPAQARVGQLLEATGELGRLEIIPVGQGPGAPGRLGAPVRAAQPTAEPLGDFVRMILHPVVDVALDARRAQHVAERVADPCLLGRLRGVGREGVDPALRELNLPGGRHVGEGLAQPAQEHANVAVRHPWEVIRGELRPREVGRIGMIGHPPGARAHPRREPLEERHPGQQRLVGSRLIELGVEVVLQGDEHLGRGLLGEDLVIGRVVVGCVDVHPRLGVAGAGALSAAHVEPDVRVHLVVDDEVGDAAVAVLAVVEPGQHAEESAIVRWVVGRAEDVEAGSSGGAHPPRARPGRHAIRHGRHHQPPGRPGANGGVHRRVHHEAAPAVLHLARAAGRCLDTGLPVEPRQVHGHAARVVPGHLVGARPEVRLQPLDPVGAARGVGENRRHPRLDPPPRRGARDGGAAHGAEPQQEQQGEQPGNNPRGWVRKGHASTNLP